MKKVIPKIIAIVGPTASGKSDLAIFLAQKYHGEIVSVDSRQIYRAMDLGTGKVTAEEQKMAPHHLLDIVNPNTRFSAGQFKKKAEKVIQEILKRGSLPILCGGTGFWLKSIIDNLDFPHVLPNWELRKSLEKETAENLFIKLRGLDSERAKNIDPKNKVRLIRSIEIALALGTVPKTVSQPQKWETLQIGLTFPKETLKDRIKIRLEKRLEAGMLEEVKNLHQNGVSWSRLESFGLEYKWLSLYLQNKIDFFQMKKELRHAINQYAKRQMTWFKKDLGIFWIEKPEEADALVKKFLKK